jgi:hypothetical protein
VQDISLQNRWQNIFVHLTRPNEDPHDRSPDRRLNCPRPSGDARALRGEVPRPRDAGALQRDLLQADREVNVESLFAEYSSEKRVREKDITELRQGLARIREERRKLAEERDRIDASGAAGVEAANRRRWLGTALQQANRGWRSHWVEVNKK